MESSALDASRVTESILSDLKEINEDAWTQTDELKATAKDLAEALDAGDHDKARKRASDVMALAYELTSRSVRLDAAVGRVIRGEE